MPLAHALTVQSPVLTCLQWCCMHRDSIPVSSAWPAQASGCVQTASVMPLHDASRTADQQSSCCITCWHIKIVLSDIFEVMLFGYSEANSPPPCRQQKKSTGSCCRQKPWVTTNAACYMAGCHQRTKQLPCRRSPQGRRLSCCPLLSLRSLSCLAQLGTAVLHRFLTCSEPSVLAMLVLGTAC